MKRWYNIDREFSFVEINGVVFGWHGNHSLGALCKRCPRGWA